MALALAEVSRERPAPSLAMASVEEKVGLDTKLEREREWYSNTSRLQNKSDIALAILRRELVRVEDTDDIYKVGRFRSQPSIEGYTPYLTPRATRMLTDFGNIWRTILWQDFQVQTSFERLAVTSMVRTQRYQDRLVADPAKLASPDSTHCTGNAVDIDVSAYYRFDAEGNIWSHAHPGRKAGQIAIGQQLETSLGKLETPTLRADWYDPTITDAAVMAAERMHAAGSINLVKEFTDTPNACLHMAVNPDY